MCGRITFGGGEAGDEFVHGLAREDEAAGVHLGIAREAVEKFGHMQGAAIRFFLEGQVAAFLGDGDGLRQFRNIRVMWEAFGNTAHLKFRNAKNFGHFGKGAAGLERGEAAHHRGVCGAIFFEN